ncbi:MAG: polyphenol oxidase family protein, partial [Bacilli bacterium]
THSDVIKEVTADDIGRGSFAFEEGIEADALYTKERGLALGIFHADCVPIFFYDKAIPLIGIIHAGFKGNLKHITYKALQYVMNHEKLDPYDIKVFIGPARRKSSFEVDDETKEKIIWAGCPLFGDHFDAIESNKLDLFCLGIPFANIQDINVDTVTDEHCFSAYQKTPIGRMASLILLK